MSIELDLMMAFIILIGLLIPGFSVLQLFRIRTRSKIEKISLSYILSLALMFAILYVGALTNTFRASSIAFLIIVGSSSAYLIVLWLVRMVRTQEKLGTLSSFRYMGQQRLVMIILSAVLISVYTLFLSSRAILDSDVVQLYLPYAREIVRANGFTYSTGFDYSVNLKPIGMSVLYAWAYTVSGSISSEVFRVVPLVPLAIMILLNYKIALTSTGSERIALTSTGIFLLLPLHDRFLQFNAFYPDMLYYPLLFGATYFLLSYLKTHSVSVLLWTGIALGVASLIKAQTVFFLLGFLLVLVLIEFRKSRPLSMALVALTPIYIFVPELLLQGGNLLEVLPIINLTHISLFIFLSILSTTSYYLIVSRRVAITTARLRVARLSRGIGVLLIPLLALSSLWYVTNFLRFGSPIWTSSLNLQNFDWASELIESPVLSVGILDYVQHFMFSFVDPAVMGFVLLIPFLIGVVRIVGGRIDEYSGFLLLFGIIVISVILSRVVITLPAAYNPRDIIMIAPLLATGSAIGLASVTSFLKNEKRQFLVTFALVSYYGLLTYSHSVLVWGSRFASPTLVRGLTTSIGNGFGLSLQQTTFQLGLGDKLLFGSMNFGKILLFSLLVSIPLIFLGFYGSRVQKEFKIYPKKYTKFLTQRAWTQSVFILVLMSSVIVIPRVEILGAYGGVNRIEENQLEGNFGDMTRLLVNEQHLDGGILTFRAPTGLPYYLRTANVIDLQDTGNLAFLRDHLQSRTIDETVMKLTKAGINYLLINPVIIEELDASLNRTISRITQDLSLSFLVEEFGSWKLYRIGEFNIHRTSISLSGWEVEPRYTNASYVLDSKESHLFLQVLGGDGSERLTIVSSKQLLINPSQFDHILVKIAGDDNARVQIRFFLDDGDFFDIAYWSDIYSIRTMKNELLSYNRFLRGDVYISLISSDNEATTIRIEEISFVRIEE